MAFPTLLKNPATSELLGALATVENERAALLIRRTPQDPDVLILTQRVRDINAQLQGIAETYLQGLTNQVSALDAVANRFGGALDSLPNEEVQTARLQRGVTIQQDLYTLIQTRLKEAEITQSMKDPTLRVVDSAFIPDRAVRPIALVVLLVAIVSGLLLGVGASIVRELSDSTIRSRADAYSATGIPVIGAIPRVEDRRLFNTSPKPLAPRFTTSGVGEIVEAKSSRGLAGTASRAAASKIASLLILQPGVPAAYIESFNQLHANLVLAHRDHPIRVLVFTSALPGEGKTLSAINFALTVAARGLRVLLIDADLRCGLVNDVMGCSRTPGFTELLRGTAQLSGAARRVTFDDTSSLVVLPSGGLLPTPGRLYTTSRIREVLDSLVMEFDLVIIDTPPVNLLADAAVLGSAADAVLLVVRPGQTTPSALRYAMDQLATSRAPVIGTLLNDIDLRRHSGDDGSYRYLAEVERYYSARA